MPDHDGEAFTGRGVRALAGVAPIGGALALLGFLAPAPATPSAFVRTGGTTGGVAATARFDPASATPAQFTLLPGIGPVLADRIADARRRGGRFDSIEDLQQVPGIGPRTIEAIHADLASENDRDGRMRMEFVR
ncbi:MAG: ComEA family DNA-binding protein [Planctomycetota bacterium]